MKRLSFLLVLLCMVIDINAQSVFNILAVPQNPTDVEVLAAKELQYLLAQGGLAFKAVSEDKVTAKSGVIYIGATDYAHQYKDIKITGDGFCLKCDGNNLCIIGGTGKGTLYGAYALLERLGYRMYTPDAVEIPQFDELVLNPFSDVQNPSFAYRETLYYYPNHSERYADWHHLHNRADLRREWGMFVHTFRKLVPAEEYFDEHPEWFSEIGGKRVRDGQLCLSNTEVLETLCRALADTMATNPEATIWSVSNNDNVNACTCPQCRHLDSLYGGQSGTLVHFINQVAERFPDKTISTLAYQYTRSAPDQAAPQPQQPRDNVNIMFCSIECGRQMPIAKNPSEAGFRKDTRDWAQLTDNIFMWDYVVQFRNFLDPFPNLHVLQPNLQYFKENGIKMMFEQGTGENNKTSWMEIRTYLLAKLMWNVDADIDSLAGDFCRGYYGPASPAVMKYFLSNHNSLLASGKRLDIYGYPIDGDDGYLSEKQLTVYQDYFHRGYESINNCKLPPERKQPYLDRLRYLELPLDFAILDIAMSKGTIFKETDGKRVVDSTMINRADRFVADCNRFGVEHLEEMGYPIAKYRSEIDGYMRKSLGPNKAYGCNVELGTQPAGQYFAGGAQGLTDGRAGILNYHHNWLGFYGKDMDAAVDLGRKQKINTISIDFYFYPLSWIFLPESVEFYVSNNGTDWTKVGCVSKENPEVLATASIHTFSVEVGRRARYVKVVARPLPQIPAWHRATGNPVWIFTDEIVVD